MRFHWRRLHAGELDHELIWLLVSVATAAIGAAWLALRLPWPRCTFLAVTGLPCLTCGATRAAVAFLAGDLGGAWLMNPLVTVLLCALVVFDLYAAAVLIACAPRLRISLTHPSAWRGVAAAVVVVGVLNWAYLLRTL
jgi:hypothetical protein